MIFWLGSILFAVSLIAAAFVVIPALKAGNVARRASRAALAGAAGFLVLAIGLGAYMGLGRPDYALMSLRGGPDQENFQEAIAFLSQHIRERPNDIQGWTILGRGYLAFGSPEQAALAFRRALDLTETRGDPPSPDLMVDYAIARGLVAGSLNEEVRAILGEVLRIDPGNPDARYYLGLAHAESGDIETALSLWDGLLAVAPPDAPWRAALPNQIAALRSALPDGAPAASSGAPPDIRAMVDGLAARLEDAPDDLEGWTMLIRAYAVLGEAENARAALAEARRVFAGNDAAQQALTAQAQASALE